MQDISEKKSCVLNSLCEVRLHVRDEHLINERYQQVTCLSKNKKAFKKQAGPCVTLVESSSPAVDRGQEEEGCEIYAYIYQEYITN
jgi:hypothetical protein